CSVVSDSLTLNIVPKHMSTPNIVNIINTMRQVEKDKITPPKAGANTGATPLTNINNAKNFVNCFPLYKSLEIALEMTAPAPPQNPCTNRKAIIHQMLSTKIMPILANVNNIIAIKSGCLRPIASEIGPVNKLPIAKPIINKDKVNCEFEVVVLKSDCI